MAYEKIFEKKNQQLLIERNLGYEFTKRVLEFVFSFLGLLCISPLLIIISMLIKFDDPKGSVIFVQKRVGKNGEIFNIYKFRSMYTDAEQRLEKLLSLNEVEGAMFKMREDPRITKTGKFIRKYSIDELPQLFNVLIGNMSLIGPRPALPREVDSYTEYDKQRLFVKPGITGLWQVSGRNSLSFNEMVELDLQYINNQSIKFDFLILLKTVKEVLFPINAY